MNYHGWRRLNTPYALHVGRLPRRRRPMLYVERVEGTVSEIRILATFGSEQAAELAMKMLDNLIPTEEGVARDDEAAT